MRRVVRTGKRARGLGWHSRVPIGRGLRDEQGMTIIEVMVSITLFAVVMSGVVLTLGSALNLTRNNRNRSVAANLASQQVDTVRAQAVKSFATITIGHTEFAQLVDTVSYTVAQDTEWISKDASSGACDGVPGSKLAFMRVTVTVSWPNMKGVDPATSQTLITPPVGSYDPNSGHVGVKVFDRNADPVAGRVVTLTGPSVLKTESTTAEGCAFFAFLAPATYTVSLNTPGYVDGQGSQNPTQTVGVQVGSIAAAQFDYDAASTLVITLQAINGGQIPNTTAVTIGNTHLLPGATKAFSGAGLVRTLPSLFPYADGYSVWAGDCLDADPEAQKIDGSGAFYPGAQRQSPLMTTPGASSAGTGLLHSVLVHVNTRLGLAVVGAQIQAVHAADSRCAVGETLTVPLVTALNGQLLAALPYGKWTFQSTGFSPWGSWPVYTLDPTVASTPDVFITVP